MESVVLNKKDLDLSSVTLTYGNNINVGTAFIDITPTDSRFTGRTRINFKINPYKIDIGYESATDKSAFGLHVDGVTELGAVDHFINIVKNDEMLNVSHNNTSNYPNLRNVEIIKHVYNGTQYKISTWYQGQNIFLPNGYSFSGVLATTGVDSGFYIQSNSEVTDLIKMLYN